MGEMGDMAGAGLLAHVPTIMLPRTERLELNEGKEISLVPGLERLRREVFEVLDYDAGPAASTRTRSAPARCISGSTGLPGAGDDRI